MINVTALKLRRAENVLDVSFDDGWNASLTAEFLRIESPSAEVQGHRQTEKRLVAGKAAVTITAIEPVGNYAVRLIFSDGHDTGIFSWEVLYRLACDHGSLWAGYLARLAAAGLSR